MKKILLSVAFIFLLTSSLFSQFQFEGEYYKAVSLMIIEGKENVNGGFDETSRNEVKSDALLSMSREELIVMESSEKIIKIVISGEIKLGKLENAIQTFYAYGSDPNHSICRLVFIQTNIEDLYIIRIDYNDAMLMYFCYKFEW